MHPASRLILLTLTAILPCAATLRANTFLDALPPASTSFTDVSWNPDSVKARMSQLPLDQLEGLWRMSDDGALLAIERHRHPSAPATDMNHGYRIVMVQSPSRHPRPGTLVGYASPTAKAGIYEARIYTSLTDRLGLERPRRFLINLNNSENRFTLKPIKSGIKLNLWRLVPYMFRYSVRVSSNRPDDIDGAFRMFPQSYAEPLSPRYL